MCLLGSTTSIQILNVFFCLFSIKSMCKTEDHVYINFIKLLELYGVS